MRLTDWIAALAAVVIFGLIWLRTKLQYRRQGGQPRLTPLGWRYFGGALGMMALGALIAPFAAPLLTLRAPELQPVLPSLARVLWFLATYYLFIGVHHLVKARGGEVFAGADSDASD